MIRGLTQTWPRPIPEPAGRARHHWGCLPQPVKTFFTDSRRASGARNVIRRGTAVGPRAYGLRPTRTPPHLTGSRPPTTERTPRFSLGRPHHRAADPSLEHPADTPGRSSPSSSTVRVNTPCSCPTPTMTPGLDSPSGLPQALRYRSGGSLCPVSKTGPIPAPTLCTPCTLTNDRGDR